MQELDDRSNGAVSNIYLSGNPGCGKTQIARQIGQEFFTRGSGESEDLRFVATLNAETLETLADSYISLARQLGITEYTLTNLATTKGNSPKEKIQHLQCLILPKIKQFSKWFIIADNVVDLSLVCGFLPQTACEEWGHGQVLVTTQDSGAIPTNAPHTYHESLSAGMQPEDAVELLKQVSQISGNDEQVQKVAEVLEYQPLALAAAAFYVRTVASCGSPTYDWTSYMETLDGGKREATEEPLAKGNPAYSKTMTKAIQMAIDSSLESEEVLRQTFLFFSLCDSESLPVEAAVNFVKARTSGQTEELIRAKILKSSLITCLYSEDGASGYLIVHNVVYEILRKMSTFHVEFTEKLECISVAIQVFHSLIKSKQHRLGESGHVYVMLRRITTHCKALYEILTDSLSAEDVLVKELTPFITPDNVCSWLSSTASLCYYLRNPSNANLFSTSACNFVQYASNTREGDLIKADVFDAHGSALSMICQYKSSIPYHKEASKIYETIYGEYHHKLAHTDANLGNAHANLGQYSEAKEFYEKALIINKKIFPEEHANVASSYNNLGNVYLKLGQYNEAKEFYEKALIINKKIFPEEHAHVASSYNNLGRVYQDLGQYNEAKEFYEKALIIKKKIFPEEHAIVASSYNNLGSVYQDLGQYNEAKEFYEKALIIQKKIFPEEHAIVASSYNNLGSVYQGLGQYNEAKEFYEKALIIRKKIFPEEHAIVASSYNNLGSVYQELGQYNEAKEFCEKALIINKKIFPEEHAHVASSYNNLGSVYQDLGQYNEAKEFYEKALIIKKKIFPEEHAIVASSYNNLGSVYQELGQYNEAKEFYEKALIIRKKIFPEEHAIVASSYNNLGSVYQKLGQYNEAKEFCEKALIIQKKIFPEEHANVASSYNNLGSVYQEFGQYNEAKEFYEKALIIWRKIFGEEHPNITVCCRNLRIVDNYLTQRNQTRKKDCILL